MVSKYMIAVSYRKPYTRRRVRTVWGQTLWKPTVERRQGAECRAYYNLGGAMKIRSATFFMSRGAERKWQRTVFSLSAMPAE